jgi:hypothetical protein
MDKLCNFLSLHICNIFHTPYGKNSTPGKYALYPGKGMSPNLHPQNPEQDKINPCPDQNAEGKEGEAIRGKPLGPES